MNKKRKLRQKVYLTNQERWYRKGWLDAQETVKVGIINGDKNELLEWVSSQECESPKNCGHCIPCRAREDRIFKP